jgi:hypothetical protein
MAVNSWFSIRELTDHNCWDLVRLMRTSDDVLVGGSPSGIKTNPQEEEMIEPSLGLMLQHHPFR